MVFSVRCYFFKPASWHLLLYQYRSIHFDTHMEHRSTALLNAEFHVPLLYFEHLALQRSLHGPVLKSRAKHTLTLNASCKSEPQICHNTDLQRHYPFVIVVQEQLCVLQLAFELPGMTSGSSASAGHIYIHPRSG